MYLEEELQRQKIISSPTGNFSIRGILMCQRKPLRQNIITATRGNHCVTRRFFSNRRKLLLRCIGFAIEVSQGYFFVEKLKPLNLWKRCLLEDETGIYATHILPYPFHHASHISFKTITILPHMYASKKILLMQQMDGMAELV